MVCIKNQSSLASKVTKSWTIRVQFPTGAGIFLLATMSRLTLGPFQPPNHWLPRAWNWALTFI